MAFVSNPIIFNSTASSFCRQHVSVSNKKPNLICVPQRKIVRDVRPSSGKITCCAPANPTDRKKVLLNSLREIIDPDLGRDIVTLGFVQDVEFSEVPGLKGLFDVSFKVELTTPACPIKDVFKSDCKRLAEDIDWIGKADVIMTAAPPRENGSTGTGALDNVGAIVAVASCKGGVGKSTTAVNLAFSLAAQGARVGIMDADIYGPSLPTLVTPDDEAVQFWDGKISPLEAHGVKLMSFGYVNPDSAIMRGPMIANVLNQLLTTTRWGVLDYLIIDMPPGTGDVQLTLSQIIQMTAAVIVTTPQKLSFVDVVKGIDMFDKVNVPSIAVIENMSYFTAPESGVKHFIFGKGHRQRLVEQYGLGNSFSMPIDPALSENSDNGVPFVVANPSSELTAEYHKMAAALVQEVAKIKFGALTPPTVSFDEESNYIIVETAGSSSEPQKIWPATLRRMCRCALCIDEMTGVQKLNPDDVEETEKPMKIAPVGNYAVEIIWSDGHPSLYPYSQFVDSWDSRVGNNENGATSATPVESTVSN